MELHASHPVLAPTYNPTLFARAQSLAADISYFLETPESTWQSHPLHTELTLSPPKPFEEYRTRITHLAESDPARLLAHAYVRYLGDLSGGQFIRRRIAKAYGLEDGAGVSFYEFKQLGGNASSTIGDMKKIKEWYRDGMNAGAGEDQDLKAKILEEANIAFELNSGLFTTLKAPTNIASQSVDPAAPPLGEPMTPTDKHFDPSPLPPSGLREESKVVFDADKEGVSEGTYRISAVIAFIAAVSLSHFILVVGGFTGSKGAGKLNALQQWFEATFSTAS